MALCRKEPWAHHALAHVMLTQGRITEGAQFMASVSDTWTGLNSFMVTHNWWHQALFLLEQDRHAEVLALYDSQVWVSSHSPVVLARAKLDQLLCARLASEGGVEMVAGTDHPRLQEWRGGIDLGSLFAAGVLG